MSQQQITAIAFAAASFGVVLFWLIAVIFVYRDTRRRGLSRERRWLWVLLALFPVVGPIAYLLARPQPAEVEKRLARPTLHASRIARKSSRQHARDRITLPKPQPGPAKHLPTIALRDPQGRAGETLPALGVTDEAPVNETSPACVLSAIAGPHRGQEFILKRFPARIGRGPEAAITLDRDTGVSRRHAELYLLAGALWLRDLNSKHGTTINGLGAAGHTLASGDRIRVGYSVLEVSLREA